MLIDSKKTISSKLVGMMTREQYNEMMNNSKEEHTKNINHAIELRTSKANNTEFYYKLNNLTDKIKRFKVKF